MLTIVRIQKIHSTLINDSGNIEEFLKRRTIFEALYALDFVVRLSEEIFHYILSAKRILENVLCCHSRIPGIFSGLQGQPSYDLKQEQLQAL